MLQEIIKFLVGIPSQLDDIEEDTVIHNFRCFGRTGRVRSFFAGYSDIQYLLNQKSVFDFYGITYSTIDTFLGDKHSFSRITEYGLREVYIEEVTV